jgi:hypothetical protein
MKSIHFTHFPPNVQILMINHSNLVDSNLANLPSSLRKLEVKGNRLKVFPDVSRLAELEDLDLSENDISSLNGGTLPMNLKTLNLSENMISNFSISTWPQHLVELNLSQNRLTNIDTSFDFLIPTCKVDFSYNDFPSVKYNAFTFWLKEGETDGPKIQEMSRLRRFNIPFKMRYERNEPEPVINPPTPVREVRGTTVTTLPPDMDNILGLRRVPALLSTYNDEHNVHASSIQSSVNESVRWLLNSGPVDIPSAMEQYKRCFKPKHWWNLGGWIRYFETSMVLDELFSLRTVHSVHGITCGHLLASIWNVIANHPDRREILDVMQSEISEMGGICFTGRFTKILNCLSGFFPQANITVSNREHMQNRIVQAIKKVQQAHGPNGSTYTEEAKKVVKDILIEFKVPDDEHEAWLDAI